MDIYLYIMEQLQWVQYQLRITKKLEHLGGQDVDFYLDSGVIKAVKRLNLHLSYALRVQNPLNCKLFCGI